MIATETKGTGVIDGDAGGVVVVPQAGIRADRGSRAAPGR